MTTTTQKISSNDVDRARERAEKLRQQADEAELEYRSLQRQAGRLVSEQRRAERARERQKALEAEVAATRKAWGKAYGPEIATRLRPGAHYWLIEAVGDHRGTLRFAFRSGDTDSEAARRAIVKSGLALAAKVGQSYAKQLLDRAPSLTAVDPSQEELRALRPRSL